MLSPVCYSFVLARLIADIPAIWTDYRGRAFVCIRSLLHIPNDLSISDCGNFLLVSLPDSSRPCFINIDRNFMEACELQLPLQRDEIKGISSLILKASGGQLG